MLLSSYEKDCSMLEKAKTMRDALREVKLKLERARIEQDKEQKIVKDLEKERDKAEKELRDAEEQEITLHCNVNELAVRAVSGEGVHVDARCGTGCGCLPAGGLTRVPPPAVSRRVRPQRKEEEMLKDLEMMQRENNQLVQPQLQRLNDEIIDSKEECARYDATAGKLAEASAEIQGKIEALQKETHEAEEEKSLLMAELAKLRGDPARLK